MTLVKWHENRKPAFSSIMDEFFNGDPFMNLGGRAFSGNTPSVNVRETDNEYVLEVSAPGRKKDDFKIEIDKDRMTISSETKAEKEEKQEGKYTRREFSYTSFSRSFVLPQTVDKDKIDARYENGVLMLTVPKMEEAQAKLSRTIEVK